YSGPALPIELPATSAAASTTAPAVAAAAGATFFTRLGLVDRDRPATDRLAVQRIDRRARIFVRGHFYETEALGLARITVGNNLRRSDSAVSREQVLKVLIREGVGQSA